MANLHEQNHSHKKPSEESRLLTELWIEHMILAGIQCGRLTSEDVANHPFLTDEKRNAMYLRLLESLEKGRVTTDKLCELMSNGLGFHINPDMIK